ncbi:MAG: carbon-nitrogen hydrolase family protein [Halobacteriota archaeon]|nr:carbon-nitrogen hydrolase family protein [Halobacteriota archaeon]
MSEIVAASIQMRVGRSLDENIDEAARLIADAANRGAEVACLPEYFSTPGVTVPSKSTQAKVYPRTIEFLKDASMTHEILLAGNTIELREDGYYNTCYIFDRGDLIGKHTKVHITKGEERFGLKHGSEFKVFGAGKFNVGVLVCADVLYPEAGRILGLKGADIVFNPVVSFLKEEDPTKEARNSIFIARSFDNDFFLLKAGSVGKSPFGTSIAGRSLITSPWGILSSARDEFEPEVILATLDMKMLHKIRKENYSLYRRVKEAYCPLVK